MLLLTSLLPLLATFAVAEQLSEGASSCVSQAIEATGCSSDDSRCICSSDLFQTTHQDCIATNLDEDEVDSAVAFAEEFCDSVSHIEVREAEPERPSGYGKPSYKKKGKKHRKHKKHGKKHRKHKKKYGKGVHYKGNKKQPWWKRPWYSQPKKDGKPRYPVGKKPSYGGGKKHDNQPWWKKPWNSYKPKYGKKPKHPKKPHYPKRPHHGKPKHPKPHHPKPPKYPGKDKPTPPVYQPPTPTKTPCTTTTPPPTGYPTQPPTYYTSKPVQTVY